MRNGKSLSRADHLRPPRTGLIGRAVVYGASTLIGFASLMIATAAAQATEAGVPLSLKNYSVRGVADWRRAQQLSNGYLVSYDVKAPVTANVVLDSVSTHAEIVITPKLGETTPAITGAAVVSENLLAVAGKAPEDSKPFLAFTDFEGRVSKIIDLGSFTVSRLCTTTDGVVWVLGQDTTKEYEFWRNGNDTKATALEFDYDMLRAYSSDGTLLKSDLKRSALRTSSPIYVNLAGVGNSALACGSKTIGTYIDLSLNLLIPVVSQPLWAELNRSDDSLRIWHVTGAPSASTISGLTEPFETTPYASFQSHQRASPMSGIYTLALGVDGNARWLVKQARSGQSGDTIGNLKVLGSAEDGSVLAVNGVAVGSADSVNVVWTRTTAAALVSLKSVDSDSSGITSDTTTPPPTSTAGDVQHYVDWADGVIAKVNSTSSHSYYSMCYTSACTAAMSKVTAAITAWKATINTTKRTVALSVTTKTNLVAGMNALNSAFSAEPIPNVPKGGGGGCGVGGSPDSGSHLGDVVIDCFVKFSESDADTASFGVHQAFYDGKGTDGYFASQYPGNYLLKVNVTCEQTCDTNWHTTFTGTCTFIAVISTKTLYGSALGGLACLIAGQYGYLNCVSTCGPGAAQSCPNASDYYDTAYGRNQRGDRLERRVPPRQGEEAVRL